MVTDRAKNEKHELPIRAGPDAKTPTVAQARRSRDARRCTHWSLRFLSNTVGLATSAILRITKAAISLVWYAAHRSYEMLGLARKNRAKLIILYFHAVRAGDIRTFRRQLKAIKTHADVVDADYVGKSDGRPKVAITFDDAFMSVVDNALPELLAREMPCTIFVPTGHLGKNPAWQMECATLDRHEIVASEDILRALLPKGAQIGAHSRSHPKLTLIGPNEAEAEIRGSKADLECLLGQRVELFAFPYGDFNQQILHFCEQAGYRFVYSIGPGSVDPMDTTMLRPRVAVTLSETRIEFWLKLRGGYDWMQFASAVKRKFFRTRP